MNLISRLTVWWDEWCWDRLLRKHPEPMERMATEARREHAAGETMLMEEFLAKVDDR